MADDDEEYGDEDLGNCIICQTELIRSLDADPNGEMDVKCARCVAEEAHDFDRDPDVEFTRGGNCLIIHRFATGCYGIVVKVVDAEEGNGFNPDRSEVTSDLHAEEWHADERAEQREMMLRGMEELIKAHATEGVDISTPGYVAGIEMCVAAIEAECGEEESKAG